MESKKLEALLMAVDLGSFTKAAEVMGYTQSGLTHMMNSLEREVGFTLLERGRGGVRLTKDGEEIARCYGEEEDDAAAQKETVTQMEVALPQFLVGFKCETNEGDLLRQSLIGEMASDVLLGDSSPLYQRLYDEGLINSSFGGGFDQLPGVAVLCAGGESGQPQEVSDAILEEAQRLAREGIDPDFFEQIHRASFGATLRALNSFENIAISMADGYFRGFDALRFPEAYASIEKADVERFLRENLTDSRRAISIIEPKKEG